MINVLEEGWMRNGFILIELDFVKYCILLFRKLLSLFLVLKIYIRVFIGIFFFMFIIMNLFWKDGECLFWFFILMLRKIVLF